MSEMRLAVIKASGGYLVNNYYKVPATKVRSLDGVLGFVFNLSIENLQETPTYRGLSYRAKEIIETTRRGILLRHGIPAPENDPKFYERFRSST